MNDRKGLRILSLLLACVSVASTSACSLLGDFTGLGPMASSSETDESEMFSQSSESEESESSVEEFIPEKPDEDKLVLREETDEIGHRIVYYTDGTFEDLGREKPIDFSALPLEKQYAYNALKAEEKGDALCSFYADMYAVAESFHEGNADLAADEDGYYTVGKVDFSKWGLTEEEAISVWRVFSGENPVYYWISSQTLYTDRHLYLLADGAYAKRAERRAIQTKIKELALDCDSYLSGTTPLVERALTIYDYLIYAIEYAYEADGVTPSSAKWAHNITGAALYGKGVCETYAQTFDYFCQLFAIDCLTVVGMAGNEQTSFGGHAWNYLCLDEDWYAVDVTWGDQQYLLRRYFGQELADYNATHIADTPTQFGSAYQCALPALSQGLCPVLLSKDGETPLMQPSIDSAFEKMTDEGGRYEITLYPDTKVTAKKGEMLAPSGAKIFAAETLPKVAYITFKGWKKYIDIAHTQYYQTELATAKPITLQCGVRMDKVTYDEASWIQNGHLLFSL